MAPKHSHRHTKRKKSLGIRSKPDTKKKAATSSQQKHKSVKNQIRSIERFLKRDVPVSLREAQEKRLEHLKKQASKHSLSELERKMSVRYRKVKFIERRKIERKIRRLEKDLRSSTDTEQQQQLTSELMQAKEDLEYVRFFPKTVKYVSLFMGNDDESVVQRRNELRAVVKSNLAAAAAAGLELEETGSEDEAAMEMDDDDFFVKGSDDDAEADDEWTDKGISSKDDSGAPLFSDVQRHLQKTTTKANVRKQSSGKEDQSNELRSSDAAVTVSSNNEAQKKRKRKRSRPKKNKS